MLYLIWSQSIVFGVINLWEVQRLTSQLAPPCTFLWNSVIPEFLYLFRHHNNSNHKKNQRKQKTRGKKQPTELFALLVILPKTHGQNDYQPRPLGFPKQQDVGPFSLCCCWLFSFSGLHPRPKRWRGQPIPQHLESASEKVCTLLHGVTANTPLARDCFMLLTSAFICMKIHLWKLSILGNTKMPTFTFIQTHTNKIHHLSTNLPIHWFIYFLSINPLSIPVTHISSSANQKCE